MKTRIKKVIFIMFLSITIWWNTDIEAKAELSNAKQLTYNVEYIEEKGKDGFYSVDLPYSGWLNIELTTYNCEKTKIYIYNSNSQLVRNMTLKDETPIQQGHKIYSTLLERGTYYIEIITVENGYFKIKPSFTNGNETFNDSNNTLSTASGIELNNTYTGLITWNDDQDIYKVNIENRMKLNVTVNSDNLGAVSMYIYNSKGDNVFYKREYSDGAGVIKICVSDMFDPGEYYIVVSQYSSYIGKYKLQVYQEVPEVGSKWYSPNSNIRIRILSSSVNGGTAEVYGAYNKKKKSIIIEEGLYCEGIEYKIVKIRKNAFVNYKKLNKITIYSKDIKKIEKNAFKNINKKAKFYVPKSKKKAYKKMLTSKVGFKKTMKVYGK